MGQSTINGDFPYFFVCLPEGISVIRIPRMGYIGNHTPLSPWFDHGTRVVGKLLPELLASFGDRDRLVYINLPTMHPCGSKWIEIQMAK